MNGMAQPCEAVTGILLAAGRGRRFDPLGIDNKLLQLLPDATPVVAASARALLAVTPRVVAVVRPGDMQVAGLLQQLGCTVTVCADADAGMGHSLAHAVHEAQAMLHASRGWLVALGDMPFVAIDTLRRLHAALLGGADIVAPSYQGQRGHPVGFGQRHGPVLTTLSGDRGARALLAHMPIQLIEVHDPAVLRDIDYRADLPVKTG